MITVYTRPGCSQCMMTKKMLEKLEVEFVEINVDENPSVADELRDLGYRALPVVEDGTTGEVWTGHRPERVKKLAREDD